MDQTVFEWVQARLAEVLEVDPSEIAPQSHLADDLDADSIDLIETINAAEARFGTKIEEQELYDLETVGQLAELIERSLPK
jgi:acyl carrier protein